MPAGELNNERCREYYQRNKEKRKAFIIERQREIKRTIQAYKLELGCQTCGYRKCARALHFHHRDGVEKEGNIGRMTAQGRSIPSIMEEIAKCDCVCSNCHAELHAEESECLIRDN